MDINTYQLQNITFCGCVPEISPYPWHGRFGFHKGRRPGVYAALSTEKQTAKEAPYENRNSWPYRNRRL